MAAFEIPCFSVGCFAADTDMSNLIAANGQVYQFCPVWLGAAVNIVGHGQGGAALQTLGSKTTAPLGILQSSPVQNEVAHVMTLGVSKVLTAGAWAVDDPLTWNASGQLIKAATGSGKLAIAKALEASSGAGEISTALLLPSLGVIA